MNWQVNFRPVQPGSVLSNFACFVQISRREFAVEPLVTDSFVTGPSTIGPATGHPKAASGSRCCQDRAHRAGTAAQRQPVPGHRHPGHTAGEIVR